MDDKKNEKQETQEKTGLSYMPSIPGLSIIAAGVAACWGAQVCLPYGDLVNKFLPIVCSVIAGITVGLLDALLADLVGGFKYDVVGEQVKKAESSIHVPRSAGGWIVHLLARIFLFACAGMGAVNGARAAVDATSVVYWPLVIGGSFLGFVEGAAAMLGLALVLSVVSTIFDRDEDIVDRCWLAILVGLIMWLSGNLHAVAVVKTVGLVVMVATLVTVIVIVALSAKRGLPETEDDAPEEPSDDETVSNTEATEENQERNSDATTVSETFNRQ